MTPSIRSLIVLIAIALATVLAGCNEHAPMRENTNAQNEALANSKVQEISPAAGLWKGSMHVYSNNTSYPCQLEVTVDYDLVRSTDPSTPTEIIRVPKLKANMKFPVLADGSQVTALLNPMGWRDPISVDKGNYDQAANTLELPYYVPTYTSDKFGTLRGSLNSDKTVFNGKWDTTLFGIVGDFTLVKQ